MSIATMTWRARPTMRNGLVWIMICSTRETSRHCVTRGNRLIRDQQIVIHGKTSIMLQIFGLQKEFSVVLHWHREPDGVDIRYRTRCDRPCCISNGPYMRHRSMMTSSNGSIFRVTGPLCGEFTGHWWIPLTKASDAELWCFLWSGPE